MKKNYKFIMGIFIGTIVSSSVSYDNTTSGARATDFKETLDELYDN